MLVVLPLQVLVKEGILCICAGGGGIPVALEQEEGETQWRRHGVEAVIDKVVHQTQTSQHTTYFSARLVPVTL